MTQINADYFLLFFDSVLKQIIVLSEKNNINKKHHFICVNLRHLRIT